MIVHLARHGQTEWNLVGRKQGRLDSPLTELGVEQARSVARTLRGQGIDRVFSSPLGRARTTAEIHAVALGLAVEVVDDLAEADHGRFAGLTADEIATTYPHEWARRQHDKYHWRFPGGESYADVDQRAARALTQVRGTRALVVSHEMIGRMLLRNLLDLEPAEVLDRAQPNNVVYEIDLSTRTIKPRHA